MKSKIAIVLGLVLVALFGFMWMRPADKQPKQVGNQLCPVSGNPVNGKDTHVHEGKQYNLCSEGCKEPLSESPEKYLPEE
ncbi:MAG TPA: hypothetical protein DCE71_04890 [Parachlamydiales bacterium]|nr:hypothetical protein [Parachlamydiales bacterium]